MSHIPHNSELELSIVERLARLEVSSPLLIIERLTRLEMAVQASADATTRLEHALLGNGKPGLIDVLSKRIEDDTEKLNKRIRYVEWGVVVSLFTVGGERLLPWLKGLLF